MFKGLWFTGFSRDLRTVAIAVVAASAVMAAPAAADYAAGYVANADRVDGKHAVGAGAPKAKRAGKLVATNSKGYLPNNIIGKATDADRLDGLNSTSFLRTANQPFAVGKPGDLQAHVLPVGGATIATVKVTAPAAGVVVLTGQAVFSATAANRFLDVFIGEGSNQVHTYWEPGDVDGWYDQHQAATVVLRVAKGAHTFGLVVKDIAEPTTGYTSANLIATFNPKGSATTLARPSTGPHSQLANR